MMKRIFIILLFTIMGCSQEEELHSIWANDEKVAKYVNSFFYEAQERGLMISRENLIVTLVNTPDGKPNPFEPGLYKEMKSGQKVVVFDQFVFETNSESENEVMVFHELGHWKGLHHCDPCPDSMIMNSHPNFYMYDPQNKYVTFNKRKRVLDQFFNLLK